MDMQCKNCGKQVIYLESGENRIGWVHRSPFSKCEKAEPNPEKQYKRASKTATAHRSSKRTFITLK